MRFRASLSGPGRRAGTNRGTFPQGTSLTTAFAPILTPVPDGASTFAPADHVMKRTKNEPKRLAVP